MNDVSSPATAADRLLQAHDRWLRGAWPLGVAAAGLAATLAFGWRQHPSPTRVEQWGNLPAWWLGGCALSAAAAGVTWACRRRNLLRSARQLDERLAAKSRLETAAALRLDTSAVARAQREETAGFLRTAAVRPRGAWLLALSGLVGALLLAHILLLAAWTRPWVSLPPAAGPKPVPPPALPRAAIQWKSPEVETKAAPIEEVPLEAAAESTTGLRDVVLEMEVNGAPRLKVPIAADELNAAGKHRIDTSIYLDQLEVQPFDVVSYHLRAQRIDPRPLPETDSPVQFVQVKPFRDDVREVAGGEGNESFALITALKAAQLRLIKENFLLGHTDLAHGDADWIKENARVGREQGVLAEKTAEVVQKLIDAGAPAGIVDLITQSRPFMDDAAKKIASAANQPALAPQGKALGLITEVEKFMVKEAPHGGTVHKTVANVEDPFRDRKLYELKQRFATHAGELELLAKEQARLAEDLARGDVPPPASAADAAPDPNKIEGTAGERQTQISQRLGAMLNGKVFEAEVTRHLESGRELARAALQALDAADAPAAREPAAAAARELDLAAAAMNKAGDEQSRDLLAQALRDLNRAAEEARTAPRQASDTDAQRAAEQAWEQAEDTAGRLAEAARRQQESGSARAAARLGELARGIDAEETRKALDRLRARPRDEDAARAAADRLQAMADRAAVPADAPGLTPDEIAQLIDRLERTRANLERLAMNQHPGAPRAQPGIVPDTAQPGQPPSDEPTAAGAQKGTDPEKGQPGTPSSDRPSPNQPGAAPGGRTGEEPGGRLAAKSPGDQPGAGKEGKAGHGAQPGAPGKPGQSSQAPSKGEGGQPGQGSSEHGRPPGGRSGRGQPGQGPPAPSGEPGSGAQPGQGLEGSGEQPGNGSGEGTSGLAGGQRSQTRPGADDPARRAHAAGPPVARARDPLGGSATGLQDGPIPTGSKEAGAIDYRAHPVVPYVPGADEAREKFAVELVEDLREAAQTAAPALPGSTELSEVKDGLKGLSPADLRDVTPLLARIDPPLVGLIRLLRAQVQETHRKYQLADQHLDLAPPAYRAAVAAYFEALSREDAAPEPTPASVHP